LSDRLLLMLLLRLGHWTKSLRDSLELTELVMLAGCAGMPHWTGGGRLRAGRIPSLT
jgi:hypothetical protein